MIKNIEYLGTDFLVDLMFDLRDNIIPKLLKKMDDIKNKEGGYEEWDYEVHKTVVRQYSNELEYLRSCVNTYMEELEQINNELVSRNESISLYYDEDDFLKAGQVMKLLNITRQTLCHYVTQGIIRTYRKKPNGQYLYDKEDVNKIFIDKNKKQSWKKESK